MAKGKSKVHRATGAAAMASSLIPTGTIYLESVKLHLDAAGGIAENFTVTINSATSAVYDTVIFSQVMTTVTDILWIPEKPISIVNNDVLDFAYANTNNRTYGLEVIYKSEV